MRYFGCLLCLTLLFSSCSDAQPPVQGATPVPVVSGLSTVRPLAVTPLLTLTADTVTTLVPTSLPTATPSRVPPVADSSNQPSEPLPGFRSLRFAPVADAAPQPTFPAGTEEIFAIWDYNGMQYGDRIRRIWFRDGQIWLTREENWNWGKYGSSGTVLDNSVYDYEGSGLKPARYHLQLYVNDNLQQESAFVVLSP